MGMEGKGNTIDEIVTKKIKAEIEHYHQFVVVKLLERIQHLEEENDNHKARITRLVNQIASVRSRAQRKY